MRQQGFIFSLDELICPRCGRQIKLAEPILEERPLTCHRRDGNGAECGGQLYVLRFPRRTPNDPAIFWVSEVTYRPDLLYFEQRQLSIPAILRYLGACYDAPRAETPHQRHVRLRTETP